MKNKNIKFSSMKSIVSSSMTAIKAMFVSVASLLLPVSLIAQATQNKETATIENRPAGDASADMIYKTSDLDKVPKYPGGQDQMIKWLSTNMQYPKPALEEGVEGQIVVHFVIDKDGSVTNVNIVKGVHPVLDAEAVRVISTMPKWKPGVKDGKRVKVHFKFPIKFTLPEAYRANALPDFSKWTISEMQDGLIGYLKRSIQTGADEDIFADAKIDSVEDSVKLISKLDRMPGWWNDDPLLTYSNSCLVRNIITTSMPYTFRKACAEKDVRLNCELVDKSTGASHTITIDGRMWTPEDELLYR